ncbi:hypothetical protein OESDEN_22356 [Oesophagostomum dentatum]|uniref:Uncharacterized protein n=1 Tax=Oesophagostomum dentatum TaxID=61180 RepID=A0A0B1RZB5_OESDE|nr:hypothetical protein OESDEN_22356 [Oesophagostomum dentatum]
MHQVLLLLILSPSLTICSTVQTSLCCCGCTKEPCPQVGATCSSPQEQCKSTADLKCSDLQKLWEDSRGKENSEKNSTSERTDTALPSQSTGTLSQVRVLTNDGLTILETGEGGKTEWREVVTNVNV